MGPRTADMLALFEARSLEVTGTDIMYVTDTAGRRRADDRLEMYLRGTADDQQASSVVCLGVTDACTGYSSAGRSLGIATESNHHDVPAALPTPQENCQSTSAPVKSNPD